MVWMVVEVFEGVVGSDEADLVVIEGPALVEVSCDVGAVEVDRLVAWLRRWVRATARR